MIVQRTALRIGTPVLLLVIASQAAAQTQIKRGWNLFSKDQDVEIGAKSAQEVEQELPVLRDDQVQQYVADLGARLAAAAPGAKYPYSFKVVDIADINAFALPGGPIFIHRGTIEAARNEGELAGVMAHEISHVALRHGTSQASKMLATQFGTQLVLGLALERSGASGGTRDLVEKVGGFGLNLTFLKYSRKAETEADVLGTQTLARAGYDPNDMATFFETLSKDSPSRSAAFLQSHPPPDRRRERVQQEAKLIGAHPVTRSDARFNDIKARIARMPPARTMKEIEAAKGSATPSSSTGSQLPDKVPDQVEPPSRKLLWHRSASGIYEVPYPSNWSVISERDASVTLAAPGGAWRSDGGADVRFGALLGIAAAQRSTGRRPLVGDATDAFLADVQRTNAHLRLVSGSRRAQTIDGGPGETMQLLGTSPSTGQKERVGLATRLLSDGSLLHLLFVTPANAPREYDDLFDAMTKNLRVVDGRLR
jgi:Zn-dependent protease with chaperone function